MKYLLITLLFVQPTFALMPASGVHNIADTFNKTKVERELPTLLRLSEEGIQASSSIGLYETCFRIDEYEEQTVRKASDILSREGYHVSDFYGHHGGRYLVIQW